MLLAVLWSAAAIAKPAGDAVAERILEALRAANAARAKNAEEAQGWRIEQERLRLVQDTVNQQIARFEAEQTNLRQQTARLQAERDALEPQRDRREALASLAASEGERLEQALDDIAAAVPPGTIPPRGTSALTSADKLQAALRRLQQAEKNASTVTVELATGKIGDAERSVELLRIGGVVAWWRALDGLQGGTAVTTAGALELQPSASPEQISAIGQAIDVAKGRQAPALVALSIDHATTDGAAK